MSHYREIGLLAGSLACLEWDERTGLPSGAAEYRADQVTLLSGLIHSRRTDPRIGEWLVSLGGEIAAGQVPHPERMQPALRCWQKDYARDTQLPQSLVEATARAISLGQNAWTMARGKNDFASFLPYLKEIIRLRKEESQILFSISEKAAVTYDVLLDQYEPNATVDQIETVFSELKSPLVELVQRLLQATKQPSGEWVAKNFPIERQKELSRWIAQAIGFDFDRGRLDITEHPFCTTLGPSDHRILTRYSDSHFNSGFFGTLHEAGHGMYEQGLSTEWFGMPPGQYASLGVHESQSRLWENLVGRSYPFWKWCFPTLLEYFPDSLKGCALDAFYADVNRVSRSLIRVEADEATYNLHVMVRFELEKELFADALRPEDLPEAWNQKYESYLGLRPPNDALGVLQDVHWSAGLFGYFPTYTLGNIYAAQLFEAADRSVGPLDEQFARGEFRPLLDWLREHIHQHGRTYEPRLLVERATGQSISSQPLLRYLDRKLSAIYS